jgi:undecaprenyl-diphosphatase
MEDAIVLFITFTMLNFQIFISEIADVKVMLVITLFLLTVLYFFQYKKDFYKIFFVSTSAMFITYTLKYLLQVPRPETMLILEDGYRFPSGHATMAAVTMSLVIYYSYYKVKNMYSKYSLYVTGVLWFVLVSYSRLYLGVHVLIDVIVGGIIGVLTTIIVMRIFRHLHYYKEI